MRKLVAILMLVVFTFNIAGYQLFYNYLSHKSDKNLERALDTDNYRDEDLITISQPINLPYYNNSKEFQRIDGEVVVGGVKYKYVKYRVYNGNIEMLCIPNRAKMQIEGNKTLYANGSNDFQQPGAEKKDSPQKSFQKSASEYEQPYSLMLGCTSALLTSSYLLIQPLFEDNHYFTTQERPPDVVGHA